MQIKLIIFSNYCKYVLIPVFGEKFGQKPGINTWFLGKKWQKNGLKPGINTGMFSAFLAQNRNKWA
ncbi:MAG: hypothetical protein Q8933_07425 [Bacteroidota bacterium]|nr:hypothetical protein [Bacteroidota bacterium]MDP4192051.1 hypothetical protein [Bacteroidota bacterium]MDP4194472.1 hypothetical protein [Bacteroidota bacterium]